MIDPNEIEKKLGKRCGKMIALHEVQIYLTVLGGAISMIGLKIFVDFLEKNLQQPREVTDAG